MSCAFVVLAHEGFTMK